MNRTFNLNKLKTLNFSMNLVNVSRRILEGTGKRVVGRQGQEKRFRVTDWPLAGTGAVTLQFGAEKRTLIQTERVTLPPPSTGWCWWITKEC